VIETIVDGAGDPRERTLLVLLPPAYGTARDIVDHGFVAAIRERGLAVDLIVADVGADYYLGYTVVDRLRAEVVAPALARGYQRLWLGGISLGGFGSLLYREAHGNEVDGLLLLAPYLGARPEVNEVARAGGFGRWEPAPFATDDRERRLLAWLKHFLADRDRARTIYTAYGTGDRFAASIELLTDALPDEQVVRMPGGHDWATWSVLWRAVLDRRPFDSRAGSRAQTL